MQNTPNRQIPIPDADPENRAPQLAAMVNRIDEDLHIIKTEAIDIRDFGAACDDTTDDAAAVQAAIDYAGSTSATRGGATVVIPDHTAIGTAPSVDRKSIILRGLGWGRRGQSGVQPYLRWIGPAGVPMLRVKNIQGFQLRDLRLIGNEITPPSCALSLYQEVGFGNNQNVIENLCIGGLIDDAIAAGTGFVIGIAFEGATANNDTWYLENVSINGCSSYVLRQNSNQNVNCVLNKLTATDSAEGLYIVGGEFTGRGWNFGAIAGTCVYSPALDDQSLNTAPNIHVIGLLAERSGRLLKMDGQGVFTAESGHFQRTSLIASDGRIVIADAPYSNRIALRNFNLNSAGSGSPSTEPYIDITLSIYGNECFKELILENVTLPSGGPNSNGIDAQSLGVLDWKHIKFTPASQGSSGSYVTPKAYDVWLGGQFGTGESLSYPATTDIPARFRFSPTWYQAIALAADQILLDTSLRLIANRTGSSITLTSTPTIPAGRNGEVISVINVGASDVVLQDAGTLSGSKLRLGFASTLTLGQYQSAQFIYLSTDQTGFESTNAWVLQETTGTMALKVPDDAYDATTWNGNLSVPTKNAVRDKIESFAAPIPLSYLDTDGTLAANSDSKVASQKAVKTYVDLAVTGLLEFKGSTNCSGNPNYPAASKGDAYIVSTGGKIGGVSGKSVDAGDVYVASADNAGGTEASVGTSWFVLEHNLVGALLAANNLSDVGSAATARTNLGLAIGTNVQAYSAELAAIALLTTTSFGRAFLELANAAAARGAIDAPQLSAANSFIGAQTILDSPPTLRLQRNSGTTTFYGSFGFYSSNGTKGMALEENFTVGDDILEFNHGSTNLGYVHNNGGFVIGAPTGGSKGAGSINAVTVWRNGTSLDKVFSPDYKMMTIDETKAFYEKHNHLPTIPTDEVNQDGSTNLGALEDRLWETVEVQARMIVELNDRLKVLEGRQRRTSGKRKTMKRSNRNS